MKKYLGIAALLGVIAFVSVSILAQAEPQDRLPAPQNAPTQTVAGQNAPPNKNMSETAASDDAASAATPRDALQKLVAITPAAGKAAEQIAVSGKDAWRNVSSDDEAAAKNFPADSAECRQKTSGQADRQPGAAAQEDAANADEQKTFAACMNAKGHGKDDSADAANAPGDNDAATE